MTVSELVKQLKQFAPDAEVYMSHVNEDFKFAQYAVIDRICGKARNNKPAIVYLENYQGKAGAQQL